MAKQKRPTKATKEKRPAARRPATPQAPQPLVEARLALAATMRELRRLQVIAANAAKAGTEPPLRSHEQRHLAIAFTHAETATLFVDNILAGYEMVTLLPGSGGQTKP